ncbi:MAG: alpha-E domain-containing protein [Longimicrobiales bacterium]|nr:alpha-E domain-containing protein [Longimicrobiales bacterium]
MISRVAQSCFWLHRYLERVDSTARALRVNGFFLLDARLPEAQQWRPLLIVSGEEPSFLELEGEEKADDGEAVQSYLVWDERNPASIYNSLRAARENARTTREAISLEMWEAVNTLWHWLQDDETRATYERNRARFYEHVQESCYLIQGITQQTMLHEEPFDFMRLGLNLERASQTARILDVKHHALGPMKGSRESAAEVMEWQAILRSCSAYEPFFKRTASSISGPAVAGFLLLDPAFPRSVLHCLERARNFLTRIRSTARQGAGDGAVRGVEELLEHLRAREIEEILYSDTHEELTKVIDDVAVICDQVRQEFFHPPASRGAAAGERGADA